jgi:large subunit ribosomal protein L15
MKAPVRVRGPEFDPDTTVNSDPKKLDAFYTRMLGEDGDKMLSEEVKWQAVTHKSFDQGRRGYNERLAYLGMYPIALVWQVYLL